jgi:two-component system sensor histidine kinase CpxA
MKTRFPLSLKILLWFFLNVAFLCAVFFVVARVQFRFGLDALVAGPAGERVQAAARLLVAQISARPRAEWDGILKSLGTEHGVKFHLFHPLPGEWEQLAGEPVELPSAVRAKIAGRPGVNVPPFRPPDAPPGGPDDAPGGGPPPPREGGPLAQPGPNGPGGRRGAPPQSMVHAGGRYWVIVPVGPEFRDPLPPLPLPAVVVVSSETLSAGGLFFDPAPWLVAGAAVIVISTLFWLPLVRGITRALSRMTAATEQIAEGRFDVRTEVRRRDELGSLSDAINRLAERLGGLVTGQKRFLGDIAHELCSPVARIQVALGILEQNADPKQKERLDDLREEVEHMSGLVNELLSFSRASLGKTGRQLQPVVLREIVDRAVARECGADSPAQVALDVPADLRALAEPELLLRAIANVLRNAVRYAGAAGPIHISAAREGESAVLRVEDSGPGIPEAALPLVFDPFYRVDSSRTRETGGVGLGLSIVKTCVESCGGMVSCENRQPSGLRVTVRLAAS